MKHKPLALLLFGAFATSAVSHAAILIDYNDGIVNGIHDAEVANGGFSSGTGTVSFASGNVPSWSTWTAGDNGVYQSGAARDAYLAPGGGIRNLTAYTAQLGDTFTFDWRLSNYGNSAGRTWQVGLVYDVAGTTTFVPGAFTTFTSTAATPSAQNFAPVSFTIDPGSVAIGNVIGIGVKAAGQYIEVDNISLSVSSVPEPATYGLLGAGALAAAAFIRRRKRA